MKQSPIANSNRKQDVWISNADWANNIDDRHSVSGNVFIMAGGAVSWLSQKQRIVTLSTSEAEQHREQHGFCVYWLTSRSTPPNQLR